MIKEDPKNYRKHGQKNKELIADSLKECGAGRSILIDNEDVIIAGNGVFEQATKQNIPIKVVETDGSELIAVKRTDLCTDDDKRKKLAAIDNAASDLSEWDMEAIKDEFTASEFESMGIELDFTIEGEDKPYFGKERQRTDDAYNLSLFDRTACDGLYDMPTMEAERIIPQSMTGFNYARSTDDKDTCIHFFIDDYQFERVWNSPEENSDILQNFGCLLSPDFSLYSDMPIVMMMWNVYRSRLLGQYWQRQGMHVIPTVSWSDERTFGFAFAGIASGSVVAVSTVGTKGSEQVFRDGFREMVKRVSPTAILLYGTDRYNDIAKETGIETYYYKSDFQDRRGYGVKIV